MYSPSVIPQSVERSVSFLTRVHTVRSSSNLWQTVVAGQPRAKRKSNAIEKRLDDPTIEESLIERPRKVIRVDVRDTKLVDTIVPGRISWNHRDERGGKSNGSKETARVKEGRERKERLRSINAARQPAKRKPLTTSTGWKKNRVVRVREKGTKKATLPFDVYPFFRLPFPLPETDSPRSPFAVTFAIWNPVLFPFVGQSEVGRIQWRPPMHKDSSSF